MRCIVRFAHLTLILTGLSGCSGDSGLLSKGNLESSLESPLNLREASLTEKPGGGYSGAEIGKDRTKCELEVDKEQGGEMGGKVRSENRDVIHNVHKRS